MDRHADSLLYMLILLLLHWLFFGFILLFPFSFGSFSSFCTHSDIRFHDLRHSAATIWIALGVSPNVIQELLGHRNIVTTLGIYGHVLPTMHKQAIDHLDELFSKKQNEDDVK